MGDAYQVLLYAVNGTGSGHLTRLIAIARVLRKLIEEKQRKINIYVVTTSEAAKIAFIERFPTLKFPSIPVALEFGFSQEAHAQLGKRWIREAVNSLKPDLIVVDSFPDGFFNELPDLITTIPKRVCVLRPSKNSYLQERDVFHKLAPYDLILVPECETDACLDVPEQLRQKFCFLGPIIIRDRQEALPRDEARARLAAAPGQKIVYLTFGGGGDKGTESVLTNWLDWLSGTRHLLVVGAGPLYRGSTRYGRNFVWTETVPICEFMMAFDAAVSAAGYMSFNELMYFGVPTIFVPRARTADDQFARVRRAVQQEAAMVLEETTDPSTLVASIDELCGTRGDILRQNARALYQRNYAPDFANEIYNLLAE